MKTALTSFAMIAACALGAAGTASADQVGVSNDFAMKFHFDKAELATADGQKALLSRLEGQVRRSCTPSGMVTAMVTAQTRECTDKAMRKALGKFESDSLASLYTSRTAG